MRRFLFWLTGKLPCYLINRCDTPYLERYYLGSLLNFHLYIHRFVRRDPKQLFHNHTWMNGLSLILSGWYIEERFDGALETVRFWNFIKGNVLHRTKSISSPDVWTLFIHGSYVTEYWNFTRKSPGEVNYSEYKLTGARDQWWLSAPTGNETTRIPLNAVPEFHHRYS